MQTGGSRQACVVGTGMVLLLTSGCGGGIALLTWLTGDGSSDGGDPLPVAAFVREPDPGDAPDEIEILFTVTNGGTGELAARVEFVEVDDADNELGLPQSATELPASDDMAQLSADTETRFSWDVPADLGDGSAEVKILVTPMEDGAAGDTLISRRIRVGNTPPTIRNIRLSSREDEITANFELADEQDDAVDVVDLELRVGDGEYLRLPDAFVNDLPANDRSKLPTTAAGLANSLSIRLGDLCADPGFEAFEGAASRGFVGTVCLRIAVRDFPTEERSSGEDCLDLNTTAPPRVQLLPMRAGATSNSVVPIHYRLFDPEKDPRLVNVHVEVDLDDGGGFQPALEFAALGSEGTRLRTSRLPENPLTAPFRTFLWDAQAQLRGREQRSVSLRARASDVVSGSPSSAQLVIARPEFSEIRTLTPLRSRSAVTGDFTGNGFTDLFVQGCCGDGDQSKALLFCGGSGGLAQGELVPGAVGGDLAVVADFDQDGFDDVVQASTTEVTLLRGGPEGLHVSDSLPDVSATDMVILPDTYEDDGRPYVAIALPSENETQVLRLTNGAFTIVKRILETMPGSLMCDPENPSGCHRLATGDVDHDGDSDLVIQRDARLYLYTGRPAGPLDLAGDPIDVQPLVRFGRREPIVGEFDGKLDHLDVAITETDGITVLSGTPQGLRRWEQLRVQGTSVAGVLGGLALDVNSDGYPDLVGLDSEGLSFFAGSRQGLDVEPLRLRTRELLYARRFGGGDLNADGFPDLVVPGEAPGEALSNDTTSFRGGLHGHMPGDSIRTGLKPRCVVTGDFDRDGVAEAVVTHEEVDKDEDEHDANLTYLGFRLSNLKALAKVPLVQPRQLLAADLDQDGFQDLCVRGHPNTVTFLRGPNVENAEPYKLSGRDGPLVAAALWDSDGDGVPEVAVAQKDVVLLALTAEGPRRAREAVPTGDGPVVLVTADVGESDGRLDLLVAHENTADIAVIPSTSTAPLQVTQRVALDSPPTNFLAVDLDADGFVDLAVAVDNGEKGGLRFVHGTTNGFDDDVTVVPGDARQGSSALAEGDFNGDGFLDVVLANTRSSSISLYRGSKAGLMHVGELSMDDQPQSLASADFDGDGYPDVAIGRGRSVAWLRGGPSGLEVRDDATRVGAALADLEVVDLDGDGFLDLVTADRSTDALIVLRGRTSGFRPPVEFVDRFRNVAGDPRIFDNPTALLVTDLTGDGKKDVVVGNRHATDPSVTILQQIDFSPRRTARIEPSPDVPAPLVDFRSPPRFRFELPPNAFESPTPVSIVLTPTFDLPHRQAREQNQYLTVVAQPVRILRATTEVSAPAHLTLLLRDRYPFDDDKLFEQILEHPEHLHVVRLDEETGRGVALDVPAADLDIVELGEGTGVRFPVRRFGSYTVVYERDL